MKIIGVDLGTTNSCVWYLDDERTPILVSDSFGRKTYPSVVWCKGPGQDIVVGHKAKSRIGLQPPPIVAIKRLMGTSEKVNLGGKEVTPVEVSAHILAYAKQLVEDLTKDQVGAAVVTIPAYFKSSAKKDTHQAAVNAFFGGDAELANGSLELLPEPEAAAYAYALTEKADCLRLLVYDLGGGTFDITILEKSSEGGLNPIKFGGNAHLGGENIDDRVALWILYLLQGGKSEALTRILEEGRYPKDERYLILQMVLKNDREGLKGKLRNDDQDLVLKNSPYSLDLDSHNAEDNVRIQKLKLLAEKAKMELTSQPVTTLVQPNVFEDHQGEMVDVDLSISRKEFNLLIGDWVENTINLTKGILEQKNLTPSQIDFILLVGGSTYMPIIEEELDKAFGRPIKKDDPNLIVARGACTMAKSFRLGSKASQSDKVHLDYPAETPNSSFAIKGQLSEALEGYSVYISGKTEALSQHKPISGDSFYVDGIPLLPNQKNSYHLEILDDQNDEDTYFSCSIDVSQGDVDPTKLRDKTAHPIRYLGTRGFKTLVAEGEFLPITIDHVCYRATQDNFIRIPIYEGDRELEVLEIKNVDPTLPINSAIDLRVVINKDYMINATATVRTTAQTETIDFQIPQLELPSQKQMEEDYDLLLDQIDNELGDVRDLNIRVDLGKKLRPLKKSFELAKREQVPDLHHLFELIGEIRRVLVEVRGAQVFMDPPFEHFEGKVQRIRGAAQGIDESGLVRKQDILSTLSSLERVGKEVWERENSEEWRSVNQSLDKLEQKVKESRPISGSERQYKPEELLRDLLDWTKELRKKVGDLQDKTLEKEFLQEIDQIENSARQVDLRSADARDALLALIQDRVKPLEYRIHRQSNDRDSEPTEGPRPTVD